MKAGARIQKARTKQSGCLREFWLIPLLLPLQITEQISLVYAVLQHLLEAVLYSCDIFMVGHAVPGVVGFVSCHILILLYIMLSYFSLFLQIHLFHFYQTKQ